MWKRLTRALAVVALVFPGSLAAAPGQTAQETCDAAKLHLDRGSLDRAKELYASVKAEAGNQSCAAEGLRNVAGRRRQAAAFVTEGQLAIRSGHLAEAKKKFHCALERDVNSVAAETGLARVADLDSRPLPTAASNGSRFYSDWALPVGRLAVFAVIGLLILYALSGLLSRVLVNVDAVAWPVGATRAAQGLGLLLLFAAAVMTPLLAMFKPFAPGWTQCWIGAAVLFGVGMAAVVLVLWGTSQQHEAPEPVSTGTAQKTRREKLDQWMVRQRRGCRSWPLLLSSVVAVTAAGILLALVGPRHAYGVRLLLVHIALALIGVLLTAVSFGLKLHLQVEVQRADGSVNAAASDYLLARMKGLGTETPRVLGKAASAPTSTPLSRIPSEELSVLPAGKVVGALSQLFFALRPDLTWRARVTFVDDNRVATALSRNGKHAASTVFSRAELGLPDDGDKQCANAQMLTGAAAFILVHLSEVHPALREDLFGAQRWKSVALQVIARSKSLLADSPERMATRVDLLAKAVNEDPGNDLARFEHVWAVYGAQPYTQMDFAAFAATLGAEYKNRLLSRVEDTAEGWIPLKIRVLYSIAAQRLNAYIASDAPDRDQERAHAREAADELRRLCEKTDWKRKELRRQTETMLPHALNLIHCLNAVDPTEETRTAARGAAQHPHPGQPISPRLAYEYACLHMFIAQQPDLAASLRDIQRTYALQDLQSALLTDANRTDALGDPCFKELRGDERFKKLTRITQAPPPGTPPSADGSAQ
ncbi:hypothetical protein [Streptomyces sp. TLI_146]|uniref:hypothetical protein n=1 Tax=Streptomyces sp. TLI_146 TaxID=1938858 RepID=UPI000C70DF42|nr:hypothetical protein [Streptomyces sp. TLI_146]PKV83002.1 hypothetical protein BX283_0490 [Streptomyces sp. TLI_146]